MPGLPSILGDDLQVLFCGTAVGVVSARRGHYYGGPGNRFWLLLHESGLTPTLLAPEQDGTLPACGIGLTDLARGITQSHDRGLHYDIDALISTVERHRPTWVAFTSLTGGRAVARELGHPKPELGQQPWRLGSAGVWVLPSPSGANNGTPYPLRLDAWRAFARHIGPTQRQHE